MCGVGCERDKKGLRQHSQLIGSGLVGAGKPFLRRCALRCCSRYFFCSALNLSGFDAYRALALARNFSAFTRLYVSKYWACCSLLRARHAAEFNRRRSRCSKVYFCFAIRTGYRRRTPGRRGTCCRGRDTPATYRLRCPQSLTMCPAAIIAASVQLFCRYAS